MAAPAGGVPTLSCPSCGTVYCEPVRFCAGCGIPLVLEGDTTEPADSRHEQARKIKPQLAEGALVRVAGARNQAEAEFVQALLLEEGVPSLLRRSAGFDVPDFLAAGPRDVLVAQSGAGVAREVLLQAELLPPTTVPRVRPVRLLGGLLVALALGAAIVWLAGQLLGW